jgi:hypothetical protein
MSITSSTHVSGASSGIGKGTARDWSSYFTGSNVTFKRAHAQVCEPVLAADPPAVTDIMEAAGLADVAFIDVREPIYYGPDVATALDWVSGFTSTREAMTRLRPAAAADATRRLREMLDAHLSDAGIWFNSSSWIVSARRN